MGEKSCPYLKVARGHDDWHPSIKFNVNRCKITGRECDCPQQPKPNQPRTEVYCPDCGWDNPDRIITDQCPSCGGPLKTEVEKL